MREFIRHPTDIPIEHELCDVGDYRKEYLKEVSHGGLSFRSSFFIEPGSIIRINISVHKPPFSADGIVVWCLKNEEYEDGLYDVGVEFNEKKTEYTLRMVEQVCYIEHYKKEILHEDRRKLTGEEAAIEWINKYAKNFTE